MPKYAALPVLKDIAQIEKVKKAREASGNPLGEEECRKAVEVVLKKYCKLGVENAKARLDYVTKEHESAKKTLASMKTLTEEIESPDYIPEAYKLSECKAGLDILKVQQKALSDDGGTMYPLMKEFRENWEGTVKKVCDDTAFLGTYIAIRTKTMTMGKKAVALTNRIDEYVKRGELFYKKAEKARKGAEKDSKAIISEARSIAKDITDVEKAASDMARKGGQALKSMTALKKLKDKYTGKEHRVAESYVQDIETNRKTIKGNLKTTTIKKKEFDKLHASKAFLLSKEKSDVDAAYKKLESHAAEAEKDLKAAEKLFKELEKMK